MFRYGRKVYLSKKPCPHILLIYLQRGLAFLNNTGNLIHHNVNGTSVFVTSGGDWKLGGVEYSSNDSSAFPNKIIPGLDVYSPPEKLDPSKLRTTTKW